MWNGIHIRSAPSQSAVVCVCFFLEEKHNTAAVALLWPAHRHTNKSDSSASFHRICKLVRVGGFLHKASAERGGSCLSYICVIPVGKKGENHTVASLLHSPTEEQRFYGRFVLRLWSTFRHLMPHLVLGSACFRAAQGVFVFRSGRFCDFCVPVPHTACCCNGQRLRARDAVILLRNDALCGLRWGFTLCFVVGWRGWAERLHSYLNFDLILCFEPNRRQIIFNHIS